MTAGHPILPAPPPGRPRPIPPRSRATGRGRTGCGRSRRPPPLGCSHGLTQQEQHGSPRPPAPDRDETARGADRRVEATGPARCRGLRPPAFAWHHPPRQQRRRTRGARGPRCSRAGGLPGGGADAERGRRAHLPHPPGARTRGYSAEGHSRILVRALDPDRLPAPHPQAVIRTGGLDEDWFDGAWRLAPREGEDARRTVRDIMAGSPAIQLSLPAGSDAVAAVGRAALVETGRTSAAVLNHIAVAEEHRRQGLGTAVVGSLLTLAAAQGADRALLEVETTDTGQAAARMYRGLGLRPLGAYHYRVRPEGATR